MGDSGTRAEQHYRELLGTIEHPVEALAPFNEWANSFVDELLLGASGLNESALPESLQIDRTTWPRPGEQPIYCGMWPDRSVNATCERVDDGALILLHSGLVEAVEQVAAIAAAILPLSDEGGVQIPPSIDDPTALALFEETLLRVTRDSSVELKSFPLAELREAEAMYYSDLAIGYVVAHELAHVLLGHVAERAQVSEWETEAGIGKEFFLGADEIDADALGSMMNAATFPEGTDERRYFGPILLFELLDAITVGRMAIASEEGKSVDLHSRAWNEHPHPAVRRWSAIVANHPDPANASLPLCDAYLRTFDVLRRRPEPAWNAAALQAVEDLSVSADADIYRELVAGVKVGGSRMLESSRLNQFFAQSLEVVTPYVARAAMHYISHFMAHSLAVSERSQIHLGLLYRAFSTHHLDGSRVTRAALDFDTLLKMRYPNWTAFFPSSLRLYAVSPPDQAIRWQGRRSRLCSSA